MLTLTLLAAFQVVNARPQLSISDDGFSFYWAVWRGLTDAERPRIKAAGGGSLLTERAITWRTVDCKTEREIDADGERMWYHDAMNLDADGVLIPLREARRWGYRYLVLANVNGVLLRGRGIRNLAGARGEVKIATVHRLYAKSVTDSFDAFEDYRTKRGTPYDRYHPYYWPVYHDERAHKPHRRTAPESWSADGLLDETRLGGTLVWDWCGPRLNVELHVAKGSLPPAGPTREGRPEAGTVDLKIVED